MSNSIVLSVNSLLNKALMTVKLASIVQVDNEVAANDRAMNDTSNHINSNTPKKHHTFKDKVLSYKPLTRYQPHTLHHTMKGVGHLPPLILERMIGYLKGPTSRQYPHADAHLRLILAVNRYLKTPLELAQMSELRERFAIDAVAMQAPKVWKQANTAMFSNIKRFTKKGERPVRWTDKVIADADSGDMTVRCYRADSKPRRLKFKKRRPHNPDETVMLFFHGGGFCIGNIDTHHEFCHAVCARTGWSIVSVDYRLAPENPSPDALRDCIAAYAWLTEHCHTLDALSSRIVLAGDSAGGGLATLMAQQLTAPHKQAWLDLGNNGQKMFDLLQRLPAPLAQMPIYPVTDIETNYPSWDLYGEGLLLDHADVAVFGDACFQNSLLPRQHVLNSPMLGDNSKVCPTYVIAAELDVLRDEAFAYAKQIENHGIAVSIQTVLGAPHGFIHFMSVHKDLGQETSDIIDGFAHFVHELINADSRLAA
ncbi:alpha/beta hydrolase [Psychrobacter sp. B38]|uniref:alpha/beta hydrolase n=1 Tax=Psychrobacter sp. B38 TaxID=3143538 RepID=UPI00320C196E